MFVACFNRVIRGAVALSLAVTFSAAAQTNATTRWLSLSECVQIALQHNFDVQVARRAPEFERAGLRAGYGLYEPVLTVSGTHERNETSSHTNHSDFYHSDVAGLLPTGLKFDFFGDMTGESGIDSDGRFEDADGSVGVRLRQPLLRDFWIDAPRLTIRVSRQRLKISEFELRGRIMSVVSGVEQSYYDLVLAKERVTVQAEVLQRAERLFVESRQRVEAGASAPRDEKQAESQVTARRADLLDAQGAFASQQYALKRWLSDDFSQWAGVDVEPSETLAVIARPFDLPGSWRKGLSLRPDLLAAEADLVEQGIVLKYLRNQVFPQLDLVGSYGLNGNGRNEAGVVETVRQRDRGFYTFGAVLSFPLAGNRTAWENFRAKRVTREQSLLRLKQLEQDIMIEIGLAVEEAKTRYGQVDVTRQSRLAAEAALDAEQKKLDYGRSTSFVVVQLQRDLGTARLAEIAAQTRYNKALAELALREGTVFERHHLGLEVK